MPREGTEKTDKNTQLNKTEQETADLKAGAGKFKILAQQLKEQQKAQNNSLGGWIFGTSKKSEPTQAAEKEDGRPVQGVETEVTTDKTIVKDKAPSPEASQQDRIKNLQSMMLGLGNKVLQKSESKVSGGAVNMQEAEENADKLAAQSQVFRASAAPESKPTSVAGKIKDAASRAFTFLLKLLHLDGMFGGKKDVGNSDLSIEKPADASKQESKHLKGSGGLMACMSRLCHSNKKAGPSSKPESDQPTMK